MINLPDLQSQLDVLTLPLDSELRTLVDGRIRDSIAVGLGDQTHIIVIEPADSGADIIEAIGFSPLGSEPEWDWLERHGAWLEAIYTVGNSGFAFIVLTAEGPVADHYRAHCH
jgi:hypothetical protein